MRKFYRYIKIYKYVLILLLMQIASLMSAADIVNVGEKYGLPIRRVTSLCRDADGFVYGVSYNGVTRISASECRLYDLPVVSPLFLANIYAVGNDVYVLSHDGEIYKFDRLKDEFVHAISLYESLDNTHLDVYDVCAGDDSTLYISTSAGIVCVKDDKVTGRITHTPVWYVLPMNEDNILAASQQGVFKYSLSDGSKEYLYKSEIKAVLSAYLDKSSNNLWLGTLNDGVYTIDLGSKAPSLRRIDVIDSRQPIRAFDSCSDSTVLIGVDGAGVYEVSSDGVKVINHYYEDIDNPLSLRGNGVNDILCTTDKIWIATYTGGVSYIDNKHRPIESVRHRTGQSASLVNNQVNDATRDAKGRIWLATNDGLSRWDEASDSWQNFLQRYNGRNVVALCATAVSGGEIWVGSYGNGVFVLDADTGEIKRHYDSDDDEACQFVFDIFEDADGDIWIGASEGGAAMYSRETGKFTNYDADAINSFTALPTGEVMGAGSTGAYILDKNAVSMALHMYKKFDIQEAILLNGAYWLATSCHGLVKTDIDAMEHHSFGVEQNLPSSTVNAIVHMRDGVLLVGTENGLCKFSTKDFSVEIVVPNVAVNLHAIERIDKRRYLIGTSDGVIIYDESMDVPDSITGKIYVQDILVGGRSMHELDSDIDSPINERSSFSIDYTKDVVTFECLYVDAPSGCKFSWCLDGVDTDWSLPSSATTMSYANIPWGSYKMRVRLYDSGGVNVIDERDFDFYVRPPFWASWWFIVLVVIVALALVLSALLIFMKHIKEHYLEERLRFITQTMLDMQRSLNLMKAPIEHLTEKNIDTGENKKYYLNLLSKQTDRLSLLFAQLFALEEEEAKQTSLILTPSIIAERLRRRREMAEMSKREETKCASEEARDIQQELEKERSDEFLAKAMEAVRRNISKSDFGRDDFAYAMCLSTSMLYKRIKAETGLSVVEFIKSMRMNYAMELLKTQQYTTVQISEMCGFKSSSYFGMVFKKYYGMTPTEILENKKDLPEEPDISNLDNENINLDNK